MNGFAEEPRASYSALMGKAEFFGWLRTRDGGRYELKDGEIVVHAGSTIKHASLSARFLHALIAQLDPAAWVVAGSDVAVEIGEDIRYPDVVAAERTRVDASSSSTSVASLIVEVLSPSSADRDMREKLAEYTSLPSLQAYIVASQDQPIVWIWQRDAATGAFPDTPIEIDGAERSIDIGTLQISLPLSETYRGITAT